jgi:hypothetical protein
VRIIAGILLAALSISNLVISIFSAHRALHIANDNLSQTLRRRLAPAPVSGGLIDVRAFKSLPFAVYAVSGFITFLGSSTRKLIPGNYVLFWLADPAPQCCLTYRLVPPTLGCRQNLHFLCCR